MIGAVCLSLGGCGDDGDAAAEPLNAVEWTAALAEDGQALLITPATALRGARTYAVVLTTGITDANGRSLQADAPFRALRGAGGSEGGGPTALYDVDPEAAGNPYPDARLVGEGGTVHVPDRFALRGLPDTPELAAARRLLRATADAAETIRGFSTTAPIRVALSRPVDLTSITPDTLLFFEREDGRLDLPGVLAQAQRRGVAPAQVALAISFPTQPIEDDLLAIRAVLREREATEPSLATFEDPDPGDDLPIGVFRRDDAPFADFLAAYPHVHAVARGLFPSPDFRDRDGIFDPAKISGAAPAADVLLDFVLTVPASGTAPYPVVMLQHGFGGSDLSMLDLAAAFAEEGFATIAISAVSHGRRGSPLDLLTGTPVQVRDSFRQSHADQMALVRTLEQGIDVNDDGIADIDSTEVGYLGVSLGGILGATLVAVEEKVHAAVLNVAGGRVAFLGDAPGARPIYTSAYAARVGLEIESPEFETFLQRLLELGQQTLDPADGLNYARRWALEPFSNSVPRRVLIQEGVGDILVTNASTEALAAASGLVANTPMRDPSGVSGLWRFDPPGGHSIIARADVRAQAVTFLASRGTEIVDH